jgi:hypothetical protein
VLEGNRDTLREDVEVFAVEQEAGGFRDTKVGRHETVDMITIASKRGGATLRVRQRTGRWTEPPGGPSSRFSRQN